MARELTEAEERSKKWVINEFESPEDAIGFLAHELMKVKAMLKSHKTPAFRPPGPPPAGPIPPYLGDGTVNSSLEAE